MSHEHATVKKLKYQLLINKGEQIGQISFKDLKTIRKMFIQILMLTVQKKYKILIVLEDTITDVLKGKKLNQ